VSDLTQPTNTNFKIRMLFDLSGGPGFVAGDTQWFQIWDCSNHIASAYFRGAAGVQTPGIPKLGKLASLLTSGSLTNAGPWNSFTTEWAVNVADFNGLALMIGAAAGGAAGAAVGKGLTESVTGFQLKTMSKNGNIELMIPDFKTGDTVQIIPSAAGTLGPFVIVFWTTVLFFRNGNGGVFPFSG
jgi:hypothetical protein